VGGRVCGKNRNRPGGLVQHHVWWERSVTPCWSWVEESLRPAEDVVVKPEHHRSSTDCAVETVLAGGGWSDAASELD
jgi:hypothetical protein